ncbi:MAG: hypothetical protein HY067_12625 [Betaproteobacteria bacterium]|nr:hypothetical protein [Betaproteobacteria bacterium]
MGEAWFMGEERRLFCELQGDLASLAARELQAPLQEIASGTSSFGPMQEWHDWYHYMLGQLLSRGHEHFVSSLLESLITGFVALYPNGVHSPPYRQFLDDALVTLGRCMMDERCWNGTDIVLGTLLHRSNNNPNRVWCWWDASGDFSASMFFCLKYLPSPLLQGWLQSVLAIPSPHWRAQVLAWLVGAHGILNGRIQWPSEFLVEARPSVGWEWSHCLRAELAAADAAEAPAVPSLLSADSRSRALQAVDAYFTEDVYLEWLLSISSVPYLEAELAEIPSTFEGLYVRAG